MTEWLADTPSLSRFYCPGCEPTADPSTEILDARWCEAHAPATRGAEDDGVTALSPWISGSVEAGGDDNRAWCALFHRKDQ